jgi:hypothetical protein
MRQGLTLFIGMYTTLLAIISGEGRLRPAQ